MVVADIIDVSINACMIVCNKVLKAINFIVKVSQPFSYCFKGHHHLCLSVNSTFVVFLIKDWVPWVEIVNLTPEAAMWDIAIRFIFIVAVFVSGLIVVSMVMMVMMAMMVMMVMMIIIDRLGNVDWLGSVVDNIRVVVRVVDWLTMCR